jgi:type VI secretion system protein ImpB
MERCPLNGKRNKVVKRSSGMVTLQLVSARRVRFGDAFAENSSLQFPLHFNDTRNAMAQEGSVAPKERINIVYKSAADGMEEVELPLKILALGDFTGRQDSTPLEERKAINIDKDNFTSVMAEHKLGVNLAVADKLSGEEGSELKVNLNFASMDDFGPEGVLAQVPELRKLMQLRDALTALKGPLGNAQGFRKRIKDILDDETSRAQLLSELNLDGKDKG